MTNQEVQIILEQITYKPGWSILFNTKEFRPFIQLAVNELSDATLDSVKRDGTRTPWKSGKRYLSEFMTVQEIVGVVFSLIKDAEEHEMREWFRYKNASIFNPHLHPDVLVSAAKKKESFCVRDNSMTVA